MSDTQKQQIESDQEPQTQQTHQPTYHHPENRREQENRQHIEQNEKKQFVQSDQNSQRKVSQERAVIDNEGISKYASYTLDIDNDENSEIHLRIVGNETRGSAFIKYTAYFIKGHDKNGEINVYRRFSQFHALRVALVQRWPGCFIPSIPTKNILHKNDKYETVKRQRYLNDFVIKMTKLPYLYNSEQFQTFIRSKETDTSNIYSSWSHPTIESIINKYKDCFNDLAGKQIDSSTNNVIGQFYARIKKNGTLLERYRGQAKALALARDKFNRYYPSLFSKVIPTYEKVLLNEYINGREDLLVYENTEEAKLNEHSSIVKQTANLNPFWLLYDMIKNQQRDGRAFIEALEAREKYENKRNSIENKIKDNEKAIIELMQGKTNLKSVTSKGTKQQVKYKLEVENQELKKEKNLLFTLSDIISALVVYIEIPAYQSAKVKFYNKTIQKIGGFELNAIQIQADVWKDTQKSAIKVNQKCENVC